MGLEGFTTDVENKKIVPLHNNIRGNEYYRGGNS